MYLIRDLLIKKTPYMGWDFDFDEREFTASGGKLSIFGEGDVNK